MKYLQTACLGIILALMGCSPALNWRSVALAQADYRILLPCKPDRGSRELPLGGIPVPLQMVGCEAGGALFAVSWIDLSDVALRDMAYAQWPRAMQANLRESTWRTQPMDLPSSLAGVTHQAWIGRGVSPEGRAVHVHGLWWQQGRKVFHAAVYADKLRPEMTEPFFSGIEKQ